MDMTRVGVLPPSGIFWVAWGLILVPWASPGCLWELFWFLAGALGVPGGPLAIPGCCWAVPGGRWRVPEGSLGESGGSLEVPWGLPGGTLGSLGGRWGFFGGPFGRISAFLAALEIIEKPMVFVAFSAIGSPWASLSDSKWALGARSAA